MDLFAEDLKHPMRTCTPRPVRDPPQWRSTHSTTVGTAGAGCTYPTDSNDFEGSGETVTVFVRAATIALCAHILRLPIADGQALVPGSVRDGCEIIQTISTFATARSGLPCGPDGSDATDRVHVIRNYLTSRFPNNH